MTIPKHSDNIREERQAVAPYNFVPLPDSARLFEDPPSQGFYDEKLLSGTVTCKLINATPMYVRAAQTLKEYEKQQASPEPFYYGSPQEHLLIPGSSIRGMLRTLVEVVSEARIQPITGKQLFYRSVEDTSMGRVFRDRMKDKVRAGYYHENQSGSWIAPTLAGRVFREDIMNCFGVQSLYKNERPASPKRVPHEDLQHKPVFVRFSDKATNSPGRFFPVEDFSRSRSAGLQDATLVLTGDMQNKKKEFVFLKRPNGDKLKLSDEQVYLFEDKDQVTQYQKFAFPRGRRGKGTLKDGDPIFYVIGEDESQVVGFGRAFMFRLPYLLSPTQMIPEDWEGNAERYDLAEALFGYVPQTSKGRKQVAGRVFVSDALLDGDPKNAILNEKRLKILSSPKPTSFQHYLTQAKPNEPENLFHYDTEVGKTIVRGHKFYWHKGPIQPEDYEAGQQGLQDHESQYSPPVKPIREGQTFKFQIRFENLRPEELGALLWVLGKAGDDQYRLKLGMGKPYGLGSVSVSATAQIENRVQRYARLISDQKWQLAPDPDSDERAANARNAFARWLLSDQSATIEQVDELPRTRELLLLLSWKEHPSASKTRYMEMDEFTGRKNMLTGQRGRFSKRPVLPAPHVVFGKWLKQASQEATPIPIPPGYERGVVKEFGLGSSQSYGFITRSNGADIFVHRNALSPGLDDLKPGQKVLFRVEKGPKGSQAHNVKLDK